MDLPLLFQQYGFLGEDLFSGSHSEEINSGTAWSSTIVIAIPKHAMQAGLIGRIAEATHQLTAFIEYLQIHRHTFFKGIADVRQGVEGIGIDSV